MGKKSITETLGERIRRFAHAKFQGVAGLAKATGKSSNHWHAYIGGRAKPGADMLSLLAAEGCSIDWLLTGDGDMLRDASHPEHPPSVHEKGPRYVGEIEAGLPPTVMDPKTNQVIIGRVLQTTTTILTNEGKQVLVIDQRAK